MGRSQVQRNRAARGRSGRGRGGGGRGGRGGGGRSSSSSRRRGAGADLSKLGTNDFRYERGGGGGGGGDPYDGLLDDIHFVPSAVGGLGEYHGDAKFEAGREGEDLADATLSAAAGEEAEDWLSIDVKALEDCLKQIPIHERLKLPRHIGEHLENKYGGGVVRKKTLAELREESKISQADDKPKRVVTSDTKPIKQEVEIEMNNDPIIAVKTIPPSNIKNDDKSDNSADDEEGEDLEAWLDDMIA